MGFYIDQMIELIRNLETDGNVKQYGQDIYCHIFDKIINDTDLKGTFNDMFDECGDEGLYQDWFIALITKYRNMSAKAFTKQLFTGIK